MIFYDKPEVGTALSQLVFFHFKYFSDRKYKGKVRESSYHYIYLDSSSFNISDSKLFCCQTLVQVQRLEVDFVLIIYHMECIDPSEPNIFQNSLITVQQTQIQIAGGIPMTILL